MPGFDFSNHTRNAALHARGVPLPKATSTGTTIVGCIFEGGVVVSRTLRTGALRPILRTQTSTPLKSTLSVANKNLHQIAADTRATSGPIVADKVRTNLGGDANLIIVSDTQTRIAKSSITSRLKSGAPVLVPQLIPNLLRHLSLLNSSCTLCRPAASLALLRA